MTIERYSNDYAHKQLKRYHTGELTQNQIDELAKILEQKLADNQALDRQLQNLRHEQRVRENAGVKSELMRLLQCLAADLGMEEVGHMDVLPLIEACRAVVQRRNREATETVAPSADEDYRMRCDLLSVLCLIDGEDELESLQWLPLSELTARVAATVGFVLATQRDEELKMVRENIAEEVLRVFEQNNKAQVEQPNESILQCGRRVYTTSE